MEQVLHFLQIVGSRLCHDLATPVGALSMGLELLRDQGLSPTHTKTVALVDESLTATKNRLDLFRFLLGQGQTEERPLMPDIINCLVNHWQVSRFTFHVEGLDSLRGTAARLVLGAILTASEGLPRGGELFVRLNDKILTIQLQGTLIELPQSSSQILTTGGVLPSARSFFPWYTSLLAQSLSCQFELHRHSSNLIISCKEVENVELPSNTKESDS